ncbi:peptidase M4 [Roseateles aquatilis]|uniref:Peptidase M4 n=1 Tax=Roseateles aquatilis TaxID=431061 RepID=A0A2D0ALP9_9BURK|nr:peptidase M4 [Roseateles aquatilis]
MNRYVKYGVVAVAVSAGAIGAGAWAAREDGGPRAGGKEENDALGVVQAKVSLTQAVAIAEQHFGGKASRAEYERTRQGVAYDIEVVTGDKVFDVRVDADKGAILSSAPDGRDGKEDRDEKD